MACKFVDELNVSKSKLEMGLAISTPLREIMEVNDVYKVCRVQIEGCEFNVDLIPLKLVDFDIILGMNWLSLF